MSHYNSIDEEHRHVAFHVNDQYQELTHLTSNENSENPGQASEKHGSSFINRAKTLRKKQQHVWARFNGAGRRKIGIGESLYNILMSSYLNVLFTMIPVAWVAHFLDWSNKLTFALCFVSMMPLARMLDWGGEQLALYCGKSLGDLMAVTLNNAIEVALAIILLLRCELRLLQSTVVGVISLRLLLVPGMAFLTGGSAIWEQHLHPYTTQINQSTLMLGAMALVLPSAYFSALDRGIAPLNSASQVLINDKVRGEFLQMSRGSAIFLLIVYLCSRIYLQNPPGRHNSIVSHPLAPEALKHEELHLARKEPETNSWICLIIMILSVGLVAVTAQFLIESVDPLRAANHIGDEFFGIVLLPIISFSADATVAIMYFCRRLTRVFLRTSKPEPPSELAKGRAIDMSIQFVLFWFPMVVLIAWWTRKPLTMLFDMYEIALMLASAFLVNYITQDSKTNWVEGAILVVFYCLIGLWTWFYVGQIEVKVMSSCKEDIATAIANVLGGGTVG